MKRVAYETVVRYLTRDGLTHETKTLAINHAENKVAETFEKIVKLNKEN